MTIKGKKITLAFAFILFFQNLRAQESVMTDISYIYLEKLVATALENYPRAKSAASRENIAKSNINKAKLNWITPVSLSYVYSPANTLNVTNPTFFSGYQLGFFINIGNMLQTPSNVKIAKEDFKIVQNEIAEYKLTLSTEVKRRYFTYLQAMKSVEITSKAAIDAQNSLTLIKYKFERGETELEDYNNALDRIGNQNLAKINAEGNLLIAKASLEELLGVKLEEIN